MLHAIEAKFKQMTATLYHILQRNVKLNKHKGFGEFMENYAEIIEAQRSKSENLLYGNASCLYHCIKA